MSDCRSETFNLRNNLQEDIRPLGVKISVDWPVEEMHVRPDGACL